MIDLDTLPEEIREIYQDLALQTFWLHVRWEYHYRLFQEEFTGRFALLKTMATTYYALAEQDMSNEVIWALCRMTDPTEQGRKQNLTISRLVNEVGNLQESALHTSLDARWRALDAAMAPLRTFRNKRLGHTDLPTAEGILRGQDPIPERRELFPVINAVIPMVRAIMNEVESRYAQPCPYGKVEMEGGWQRMLELIEHGRRHEGLLKKRRWRWLLAFARVPDF